MHWHAIRRSARSPEDKEPLSPPRDTQRHEFRTSDQERLQAMSLGPPIPQGHDQTLDALPNSKLLASSLAMEPVPTDLKENDCQSSDEEDDNYFHVSVPNSTNSTIIPFAYSRALRSRLKNPKLQRHGEYDTRAYTPTFVHDCLMIPGSLANILGKVSPEDILHRMTPAILPGFHSHVHADTHQPCLTQSPNATDYVQGMLIFGQGRKGRDRIHAHYRPHCRRVKVPVEFDVQVGVPLSGRDFSHERWRLQRRTIWAHAWLWSNVGSSDAFFCSKADGWRLEGYLEGDLGPRLSLRVEEDGKWEDVEVSVDESEDEPEEREVGHGGCGTLDYERADSFTGW